MSSPEYAAYVAEAFESYRPKFKDFEEEAFLLGLAAAKIAEKRLAGEEAAIERHRFVSVAESKPYRERLMQLYEGAGRQDLLEAYAKPGEWGAELPWDEHIAIIERFTAAGHGMRVLRIWRHFLGKIGGQFWYWVRERDAALTREAKGKPTPLGALSSEQSSEQVAHQKEIFLEALRLSKKAFAEFGASRDRSWHAKQLDAAEAERRQVLTSKPNPLPMSEELFWQILGEGGATSDERLDSLPERLAAYSPAAIKAFGQMVADKTAAAYRADLWALAYLLMRGASDDAFDAFRNWLLLQGRSVYTATIADPDGFDANSLTETPMVEGLLSLVEQAYELRAGKPMPRLKHPKLKAVEIDEGTFHSMLPKIAAATA